MKLGTRGQVTIPIEIRVRFGLGPDSEVEFDVVQDTIVLRKAPKKLKLENWIGHCGESFAEMGYASADDAIDKLRGR